MDLEDPVVVRLAGRHGLHPAALCVKWAVQRGQVPIPFSVRREHYLGNLRAAVGPPLDGDEMRELSGVDRDCRLIKGQVFLWKEGQSWTDLWDPGGEITPP
jgi:diketogulonate reductase-like aldo/keto reductase